MKNEIEVVELNRRQLAVALVVICGSSAMAKRLLDHYGVGQSAVIVGTKFKGQYAGVKWIGTNGKTGCFYGQYDRRWKVTKVLESEFEKRSSVQMFGRFPRKQKRCA